MRGVHFHMSDSQQARFQRAQQQFLLSTSKLPSSVCVNVGDTLPGYQEEGILKGHGTTDLDGEMVATLCGVVERVNKLVLVRTLRARYKPENGDIVVGRVFEVASKRWLVDINYNQAALLMLSSMNMPDGIQRRRTAVDELNMRSMFEENDVICAEVRGFQHDGSLHLQARSLKYGKLENGQLITTSAYLVKRRKQHFHHLEQYGVDMILGLNGYIWVGVHTDVQNLEGRGEEEDGSDQKDFQSTKSTVKISGDANDGKEDSTSLRVRENICRLANAIRVLSALGFSLSFELILDTFQTSIDWNIDIKNMLAGEFYVRIAEREAERRSSRCRTAVDELNMQSMFEENDVICAEVRGFQHDGSFHLQARSLKYGKLENDQLITTSAYLVKRRKQHFHHLEQYGVDMILGLNGYIWVGVHTDMQNLEGRGEEEDGSDQKDSQSIKSTVKSSGDANDGKEDSTSLRVRENICRLANAIRVLSALGFSLSLELILDTFQTSIDWNIDIKNMLAGEFYVRIAEREAERRSSRSNV